MSRYRAVIFDVDGTLLDTERVAFESWYAAAEHFGLDLADGVVAGAVGRSGAGAVDYVLDSFGGVLDRDGAEAFHAYRMAWKRKVLDDGPMPVKGDPVRVVGDLREQGLETAVATATRREQSERNLGRAGLLGLFDAMVCGDEVAPGHGKPMPDIYLAAAGALGLEPALCLAVEDSPTGVLAASAAGMDVVLIPDMIEPDGETFRLATALLEGLDELPAWVAGQDGGTR